MTPITQEIAGKDHFLAEFAHLEAQTAAGANPAWLDELRKAALDRFAELGFPTQRVEEWRFTNVAPLTKITWRPASGDGQSQARAAELVGKLAFSEDEGSRAVFVNGRFAPALSSLSALPAGVQVASLAQAIKSGASGLIERHLAHYAPESHHFVALNTAFIEDGAFIHIARGAVLEKPIHLLFITIPDGDGAPIVTQPRNLILAEENSEARVIETYAGPAGTAYFTNAVSELVLGENASLTHHKIQHESEAAYHIGAIQAHHQRSSRLTATSVAVGGALVRNDVGAWIDGEGVECVLNGITLAHGHQHIDNHTRLDHAQPHCTSHQLYKGIFDDSASGVFSGRIKVHQDAQKTDAIQSSRNLLLTDQAMVNTQPQLEIFADDVRCTHGATVGQLDAEAIFYLRSRGIDYATARGLLTFAFANEVIEQIPIESLRTRLEHLIASRFQFSTLAAEE